MARRLFKGDRDVFYVDPDTHPATLSVIATRAALSRAALRLATTQGLERLTPEAVAGIETSCGCAVPTLVGPEMRGSSPLRIDRDARTRECPGFAGLYPVGEGAGYAGGIITAAVDGLRSARVLVSRFAPLEKEGGVRPS